MQDDQAEILHRLDRIEEKLTIFEGLQALRAEKEKIDTLKKEAIEHAKQQMEKKYGSHY